MNLQRPSALNIAVIGHTNTGKTSLLRTLLRDVRFGEIADTASTTRHVQSVDLLIGDERLRLIDTPGLEDSMGLISAIDRFSGEHGIDRIHQFLQGDFPEFSQEIKVLKQTLTADLLLYVIDSREPVLGKYQDELAVLSYSAKPVLPILNFVGKNQADAQYWHSELKKRALHAVVSFDTVAYRFDAEIQLYRAMQVLLPERFESLANIINRREQDWQQLGKQSLMHIADCLIDIAAFYVKTDQSSSQDITRAQKNIRKREQRGFDELCALFAFYQKPETHQALDVAHGIWQQDLFDLDLWLQLGIDNSKAAAKGAAIGLGIDLVTGGMSLGLGTLFGAGLGVVYNNANKVIDSARGYKIYRADFATLQAVALRQLALLNTLQARGHASTTPIHFSQQKAQFELQSFEQLCKKASRDKTWSSLNRHSNKAARADSKRRELQQQLAVLLSVQNNV